MLKRVIYLALTVLLFFLVLNLMVVDTSKDIDRAISYENNRIVSELPKQELRIQNTDNEQVTFKLEVERGLRIRDTGIAFRKLEFKNIGFLEIEYQAFYQIGKSG